MALKINERIQHLIIQETITNIQQVDTELPRLKGTLMIQNTSFPLSRLIFY